MKTEVKAVFFSSEMVRGVPWMILNKFILFFVYFAISVITVRLLGPEEYGIFAFCKSVAEFLIIICGLGLTASIIRFLPELIVNTNKAGIKRLLWKSFVILLFSSVIVTVLLFLLSPTIGKIVNIEFKHYLLLSGILIAVLILKDFVTSILTSFYKVKQVSILSCIQGGLWLISLIVFLNVSADPGMAIAAQIFSYGVIYFIALLFFLRFFKSLNWRSPLYGIGKKRVVQFAGAISLNSVMRTLMLKYTEVFFLGLVCSSAVVGIYDLAYTLPLMVITFIPAALQAIFTTGFTEAYVKDQNCLPKLIESFYKMLILLTIPIAVFGIFFAPQLINSLYGEQMSEAGLLCSAFCLFHIFPLISMPLSMAIKAKEKVMSVFPLLLMQITVNIILDYILIYRLNLSYWGAVAAVSSTFILTIPIRLYVVKRIIGGIYFPLLFFVKLTLVSLVLGSIYFFLLQGQSIYLILPAGVLYLINFIIVVKYSSVIKEKDIKEYKELNIPRLTKVLNFLSKR